MPGAPHWAGSGLAVGVDAASPARLAALLQRRPGFAARCFTAAEQADCAGREQRWAATWAAKEAVRKLYGSSGVRPLPGWREVEVVRTPGDSPRLRVRGRPSTIALSLTHEAQLAVAVAVGRVEERVAAPLLAVPGGLRLPPRPQDANKGSFGTVVVVAGAQGFSGAAYLAAMGAARAGAGKVALVVPQALLAIVATKCVEVMAHGVPDGAGGRLGPESLALLHDHLRVASAALIGPGLGQDPATRSALPHLLRALPCPGVVDADALNIAALEHFEWRSVSHPLVLTPHPGEMGRLCALGTDAVQGERRAVATRYAREHGVVVVLKGAETVIAAPDGSLHTSAARLAALASGGTGDVLGGVIVGMLAAGLEPSQAAVAGVAIHAEAGAAVQRVRGRAGALASDLLEALPAAQERLRVALEGA